MKTPRVALLATVIISPLMSSCSGVQDNLTKSFPENADLGTAAFLPETPRPEILTSILVIILTYCGIKLAAKIIGGTLAGVWWKKSLLEGAHWIILMILIVGLPSNPMQLNALGKECWERMGIKNSLFRDSLGITVEEVGEKEVEEANAMDLLATSLFFLYASVSFLFEYYLMFSFILWSALSAILERPKTLTVWGVGLFSWLFSHIFLGLGIQMNFQDTLPLVGVLIILLGLFVMIAPSIFTASLLASGTLFNEKSWGMLTRATRNHSQDVWEGSRPGWQKDLAAALGLIGTKPHEKTPPSRSRASSSSTPPPSSQKTQTSNPPTRTTPAHTEGEGVKGVDSSNEHGPPRPSVILKRNMSIPGPNGKEISLSKGESHEIDSEGIFTEDGIDYISIHGNKIPYGEWEWDGEGNDLMGIDMSKWDPDLYPPREEESPEEEEEEESPLEYFATENISVVGEDGEEFLFFLQGSRIDGLEPNPDGDGFLWGNIPISEDQVEIFDPNNCTTVPASPDLEEEIDDIGKTVIIDLSPEEYEGVEDG